MSDQSASLRTCSQRHPADSHSRGRPDLQDQLKDAPRSVPSHRGRPSRRPDKNLSQAVDDGTATRPAATSNKPTVAGRGSPSTGRALDRRNKPPRRCRERSRGVCLSRTPCREIHRDGSHGRPVSRRRLRDPLRRVAGPSFARQATVFACGALPSVGRGWRWRRCDNEGMAVVVGCYSSGTALTFGACDSAGEQSAG
jgi:hypothetical protein